MKCAPVIIPTLNRYEHFYQCLESLEKCSGAECTDVFIGLDYPPSDKYIAGWKKIDAYLANKEKNNGFHKLVVFRRDHNCGIGVKPPFKSNVALLREVINESYDRIIYTEDDNVFSPNFLEYINKGLEKYEHDDSVWGVVGYAHPYQFKFGQNNHYRHNTDMSGWGYGTWNKTFAETVDFVKGGGFRKSFSTSNMLKALEHGWLRLFTYIYHCYHKGYASVNDGAITAYLILHDKYVITPTISKVRNIGWDDQGRSFQRGMKGVEVIAERHNSQPIDNDVHFEYKGDDTTYMDYNNKVAVRESDGYMSFGQFVVKLWKSFFKLPQ